jgi:hypothetical protein
VIPDAESDLLMNTITDAIEKVAEGKLAEGYDLLAGGLRRAEELRDTGKPWGEELVHWWRGALTNYVDSYGVQMG